MNNDLFDLAEGIRRREIGISIAINGSQFHSDWNSKAKAIALTHAARFTEISADDLYVYIAQGKLDPPPSKGSMGAVFIDKRFKFLRYEKSKRKERHGNRNGVYEYGGTA